MLRSEKMELEEFLERYRTEPRKRPVCSSPDMSLLPCTGFTPLKGQFGVFLYVPVHSITVFYTFYLQNYAKSSIIGGISYHLI